jgi:hypothetical protein
MKVLREPQAGDFLPGQHLAQKILVEALRLYVADKMTAGVDPATGVQIERSEISGLRVLQSRIRFATRRGSSVLPEPNRQTLVPAPDNADLSRQDEPLRKSGSLALH